ncbi:MAG: hypothetical protein ACYC6G_19700 [Desulfobaccales bacterium]
MRTCLWLLLTLSVMVAGCAPGYYATGPSSQEGPPAERFEGMSFNNPETAEEKTMRIWREGAGR